MVATRRHRRPAACVCLFACVRVTLWLYSKYTYTTKTHKNTYPSLVTWGLAKHRCNHTSAHTHSLAFGLVAVSCSLRIHLNSTYSKCTNCTNSHAAKALALLYLCSSSGVGPNALPCWHFLYSICCFVMIICKLRSYAAPPRCTSFVW